MEPLIALAAGAGGYLVMTLAGVRAFIALFSSAPLARRQHRKNPDFSLRLAYRQIVLTIISSLLALILCTIGIFLWTEGLVTVSYLLGMILAFLLSIQRMTPNHLKNQRAFHRAFASCYLSLRDRLDDTIPAVPRKSSDS